MAVVRPFRGCRYNQEMVEDLGSVLCPPYDMIGPELKETLQNLSPYNAVHLEGGEQPDPVDPEAGYQQAASLFREWLDSGVLRRETEPRFYLMRRGYEYRGQAQSHLALFGDIQVDDYDQMSVLPHENTREPAVRDRVALLEASKTQFSPIMTLYRDAEGSLQPIFQQIMAEPPVLEVTNSPEGDVTLWRVGDPALLERITQFFAERPIFLGDGHHRYEAARRYRQEQTQREGGAANADAAHNFTMMALVEFDDPGLLLLPYHKVIKGLSPDQLQKLQERLNELFEPVPIDLPAGREIEALVDQVTALGQTQKVIGLVGPGESNLSLLKLREGIDWREWGPLAVSEAWIIDEQAIKPLLGDQISQYVDFRHDHDQIAQEVASGGQQMAFLLKPFPMDAFESLVSVGQRLPSKSTFFYPKLPTGLIMNQLEGTL